MTCNNCIHGEMCANRNKMIQIDEHTWDEYEQTDNVESLCKHFKNKADLVEVVRCKDCVHRSTDDFRSFYCRKDDVGCKDDGFCSEGERRDKQ